MRTFAVILVTLTVAGVSVSSDAQQTAPANPVTPDACRRDEQIFGNLAITERSQKGENDRLADIIASRLPQFESRPDLKAAHERLIAALRQTALNNETTARAYEDAQQQLRLCARN